MVIASALASGQSGSMRAADMTPQDKTWQACQAKALTSHQRRVYTHLMTRRAPVSVIRLLALSVTLSFLAPGFACGGDLRAQPDTSACCRAMKGACHPAGEGTAGCCQHETPPPAQPALATAVRSNHHVERPLLFCLLPVPLNLSPATGVARPASIVAGLSPPGHEPLFLLHSALLI